MLARLFAFTNAFQWSVLAGIATVGGWVATQKPDITDVPPPFENTVSAEFDAGGSAFDVSASPHHGDRDSMFVIETYQEPASQLAAVPIETYAEVKAVRTIDVPEMSLNPPSIESNPDLPGIPLAGADAEVNCTDPLDDASHTGCRLFAQLAHATTSPSLYPTTQQVDNENPIKVASAVSDSNLGNLEAVVSGSDDVSTPALVPCTVCSTSYETLNRSTDTERAQVVPTCRLRNRKTNEPMATLSIASTITSRLSSEELAASNVGYGSTNDCHDLTPKVQVSQNEYTQAWQLDAKNIELPALLETLGDYCPFPITCGENVTGTVSASISAHSMDELLHRLVVPFGFNVSRDGSSLVVGTPHQPQLEDHAEYEKQGLAMASDDQVDRLPPVNTTAGTRVVPVTLIRKSPKTAIDKVDLRVAEFARQAIGRGETDQAIRVIIQALGERPQSAFLHRMLGEAYAFQADFDRSAIALERSVKLNKYDPLTSKVFSDVLKQLGQDRRAEHYAQLSRDIASGIVVAP